MASRIERAASYALTLATVVCAVVLVRRELLEFSGTRASSGLPPTRIDNWETVSTAGVPVWSTKSKVVVVEFADLECPACKNFHQVLKGAAQESRTQVALSLVHFPLSIHRFAKSAARALECASTVGRADKFVEVVFDKQDSIGLKSWSSFADDANISDTAGFERCVRDTAAVARIAFGRALGEEMGLNGTPVIIINGWRFDRPPGRAQLVRIFESIRDDRPFSADARPGG